MLTSGGQRGDAARCEALGIAAYLLKAHTPVGAASGNSRECWARKEQAEAIPMITLIARGQMISAKSLRVLLAEDNPVNQKLR